MATKTSMVTEITTFLDRILSLFTKSSGEVGHGLYIDNAEGTFSFYKDYFVPCVQIATTVNELAGAKASIEANQPIAGVTVVDATTLQIHTYTPGTNTWTASPTNYYAFVRPQRVYFSPWNSFIWTTDKYSGFKRFFTTGLTLIG